MKKKGDEWIVEPCAVASFNCIRLRLPVGAYVNNADESICCTHERLLTEWVVAHFYFLLIFCLKFKYLPSIIFIDVNTETGNDFVYLTPNIGTPLSLAFDGSLSYPYPLLQLEYGPSVCLIFESNTATILSEDPVALIELSVYNNAS